MPASYTAEPHGGCEAHPPIPPRSGGGVNPPPPRLPGRSSPRGTTFATRRHGMIGGVQTGERLTMLGRNEAASWYQVRLADDTEGWIFGNLLTLSPSLDPNGLPVVEVDPPTAGGGGDSASSGAPAPPPVIAPAAGGNFELGGQTHSFANPTLMSMAGMNWVKFQHKWGEGDSPIAVAGRIQSAHARRLPRSD